MAQKGAWYSAMNITHKQRETIRKGGDTPLVIRVSIWYGTTQNMTVAADHVKTRTNVQNAQVGPYYRVSPNFFNG